MRICKQRLPKIKRCTIHFLISSIWGRSFGIEKKSCHRRWRTQSPLLRSAPITWNSSPPAIKSIPSCHFHEKTESHSSICPYIDSILRSKRFYFHCPLLPVYLLPLYDACLSSASVRIMVSCWIIFYINLVNIYLALIIGTMWSALLPFRYGSFYINLLINQSIIRKQLNTCECFYRSNGSSQSQNKAE